MSSTEANGTSKGVSALKHLTLRDYLDWTTSPLGQVMKGRLQDKVVLVTGASAGIGAVTARRAAAEGAKVVLFARRADKLTTLVAAIKQAGGEASAFAGDASKEEDNKAAVDFAVKTYGAVHVAFNNAGVAGPRGATTATYTAEHLNDVNSIQINGVLFAMKYQGPAISNSGGGVIINNASVVAHYVANTNIGLYSASKAWVISYSRHAANELAKVGVRVNTVSPGVTLSDFGAAGEEVLKMKTAFGASKSVIGRPVKPEEIAGAVCFLASQDAQAITGVDLPVDGGYTVLQGFNNSP